MPNRETKLKYQLKYSFGEKNAGNYIIKGDNKKVLNTITEKFKNSVKCVYIDPPYNNGEQYNHYKDDQEHVEWLNDIIGTLKLLKPLLSEDGSIWISIDDSEMHYLKVAADSVFGRKNFVATIVWQQRTTRENRSIFSCNHEYILLYAKNPLKFKSSRNLLPLSDSVLARYKNPDLDLRGAWQSISANVQAGHATKEQFYELKSPAGKSHVPPNGRCWVYSEKRMKEEVLKNNIWFGKDGNAVPRIKKFLNGSKVGLTPETLWLATEVGTNNDAKKHILELFPKKLLFDTPKPEQLIQRILQIATQPGDLVLDCYLGSGSTASTAHKMNRKYIGIEAGDHIVDYVVKRMKKVIKGEEGGISKSVSWQGGGGFCFYNL
jgi:adenine-specific DNA-methyltransferase